VHKRIACSHKLTPEDVEAIRLYVIFVISQVIADVNQAFVNLSSEGD